MRWPATTTVLPGSQVIVVGAEDWESARIMGWECTDTVAEALRMAQTFLGKRPSVAHVQVPPINLVDVAA